MRAALFPDGGVFRVVAPSDGRCIIRPIADRDPEAVRSARGHYAAIAGLMFGKRRHGLSGLLIAVRIKSGARRGKNDGDVALTVASHGLQILTACRLRNPFNGPYGLKALRQSANWCQVILRSIQPK